MSQPKPLTGDPVSRSARAAARRLAPELSFELEPQVEAALYDRSTNQYVDPVSLGSLIVSAATLAWTVYRDLRNKTSKPQRDRIIIQVKIELPANDQASPADVDKIIESVVDDIVDNSED